MIAFIIGLASFIIACIIFSKENWGFDECVFLESLLIGILFTLIGIVVAIFGGIICNPQVPEVETTYIYAMSDTMGVEGSFFLGSGSVDSEMKYIYMEKTEKGMRIADPIDTENAYINYIEEGETPRIEKVWYKTDSDLLNFLFIFPNSETYIYVPEGTVKEVYNIDLQQLKEEKV